MNENVNICITPKGDKPVLHFSQFDNERIFTVTVLADDGESAAVLTGLDIEFRLRKTDSHVVTIAPESVTDNVITFKTTEQMCACCGQNIATVTLMKDDMVISTLAILVDIQRDILSGGLTSESDIRNLTTQIEQIVPEVIGDDYYTKTEVDELIADIPTFDPSNYYDKSDVDVLLADKADADDVYTKTQVDNKLLLKLDTPVELTSADTPDAIIQFSGAADNVPMSALKVDVASGLSSAKLTRCGKNFADIKPFSDWSVIGSYLCYQNALPMNQNLYMSFEDNDISVDVSGCYFGFLDDEYVGGALTGHFKWILNNGSYSANNNLISGPKLLNGFVMYPTNETTYNKIMARYKIQVELGESSTAFEAYNGMTKTISFGQTLAQSGSLDCISGLITLSDDSTIQCDGIELDTASGTNYVFSDTGDITQLKFFAPGCEDLFKYIRMIKG